MSSHPISFLLQVQGDAEFQQKLRSAGGAFQNFGRQADTASVATQKVTRDFKGAALGMATAASSAVSLGFQFDNLQKSELRVTQAEKNLTVAHKRVSEAQQALDKLQIQGIATGVDYEQAVMALDAAKQQEAIATEKLSIAQGDLNQDQIGFAMQIIPTVIGAVSSASMALNGMGITLSKTSIMSKLAGFSFKSMGLTMKMALIGTGIGAILVGVGIALEMIATNAFGVRDAINSMGKAIGDALPFLKPVMEFFGAVGNALFGGGFNGVPSPGDVAAPAAEGPVPDWAQAGENFGSATTASISSIGSGGGGGSIGRGDINVKVYVDGKEIASRIKLSTTKKG